MTGYQTSTPLRYVDLCASSEPSGGVFDAAVVGVALVTRMTHRVHYLNPAFKTLLGRTESKTTGFPLGQLVHTDSGDTMIGLFIRAETGANPSPSAEVRLVRNDGSDVLVCFTVTSVPAVDGGSGFLLCEAYSLDAHRPVEGEFRAAGYTLETALDATTDAVYMKDACGRYLMVNRAAASNLGYPADEVIGRLDTEFFSPEDTATLHAVDRKVLASGLAATTEDVLSTRQGIRVFQSTKSVYLDGAGQPAGIFGITRDVTEEHWAEDEHRRFAAALELTVDGVAHCDHQGCFLWVNDAFAGLCGYPPAAMIGLPWAVLAHPDDFDHMTAAVAGLSDGDRIEQEVRTVRADGSWFHAQLVAVRAKGGGAPTGFYGTLRDVSDRKIAEEGLRQAGVELERRNSELEAFAAMVAHDLRQPLQVVGGFAQLLSQHDLRPTDERTDRYLAAIERGVGTMTTMVESMLEYAQAGEATTPDRLTDSHRIVDDVINGLQGAMNGGKVIIRDHLPVLPADPDQLARLFQNLIGNALKFRRADTGPTVHIAAQRDGELWRFTVEDDGIGIGPDFADQLFGMFARERRSDCPGTGMGLAICRRIVEHHGGQIWYKPAPRHGSIFSFTLPAAPPAA